MVSFFSKREPGGWPQVGGQIAIFEKSFVGTCFREEDEVYLAWCASLVFRVNIQSWQPACSNLSRIKCGCTHSLFVTE